MTAIGLAEGDPWPMKTTNQATSHLPCLMSGPFSINGAAGLPVHAVAGAGACADRVVFLG